MPGIKEKESETRMKKIPPNMVIHKHVYREESRFSTMSGPLVKDPMGKWLGVTRRGTYQA